MKKIFQLFTILCPFMGFSQYEFNNVGADIYIQKGAVVAVQGNFINGNGGSNGLVKNDGVIELKGDFENKTNASFTVHNDNTSKDRAVKFTGNGTQKIKGDLNSGTASFYNLVVDKASSTDVLEMGTNVTVDGSLVFGSANTTTTYNPTSVYTNNAQKGIIKTFDNTAESVLTITNGNTDAIAGYAPLAIENLATTGFILTSGTRGNADGGVQRKVTSTGTYVFPVATSDNGFNGVALTFNQIPAGGGLVKGKFSDGTDNPRGTVGDMSPFCANCETSTQDNAGYNRHFADNYCNGGGNQWFILENSILDHGFWTFAADANDNQYKYVVEVFPNSYTAQGQTTDTWRTLKMTGSYGNNASALGSDWTTEIENSVENITDLLEYSKNTGSCYTGSGVPGGVYTGFGQFAMMQSNSGNALPVKMLYIKAEANNNTSIDVKWATAVEINNSGFEVHRSTDGINFKNIGWVNGNNNSTTTETYSFNDNDVVAGITYYYQLRQVDFDGASEMSQVVSASLNGTPGAVTTMTVSEPMPNPAVDYSRIIVKTVEAQEIAVKIYDMTGRIVSENTQDLTMGTNNITLDVTQLASGTYTTVIIAGGKSIAKNLLVAKN